MPHITLSLPCTIVDQGQQGAQRSSTSNILAKTCPGLKTQTKKQKVKGASTSILNNASSIQFVIETPECKGTNNQSSSELAINKNMRTYQELRIHAMEQVLGSLCWVCILVHGRLIAIIHPQGAFLPLLVAGEQAG